MEKWVQNWDGDGILADAGMIPMPKAEQAKYAKAMKDLPVLTADMLKK